MHGRILILTIALHLILFWIGQTNWLRISIKCTPLQTPPFSTFVSKPDMNKQSGFKHSSQCLRVRSHLYPLSHTRTTEEGEANPEPREAIAPQLFYAELDLRHLYSCISKAEAFSVRVPHLRGSDLLLGESFGKRDGGFPFPRCILLRRFSKVPATPFFRPCSSTYNASSYIG